MLKALKDILKFTSCLAPAAVTATGNATGVDNADFGSTSFLVDVGDFEFTGTNKISILVQHADVDTDGSYAACVDADIYDAEDGANGIAKVLDATADANSVHVVHYRGTKRYARIRLVEGGTVDCIIGVLAVQGHSEFQPPLA